MVWPRRRDSAGEPVQEPAHTVFGEELGGRAQLDRGVTGNSSHRASSATGGSTEL